MKLAPVPAIPRQPALLGNRFFRAHGPCLIWTWYARYGMLPPSSRGRPCPQPASASYPARYRRSRSDFRRSNRSSRNRRRWGSPGVVVAVVLPLARSLCSPAAVAISENFVLQAPQCAPHTLRSHVLKGMMLYYGFCFAGRDGLGFPCPVRRRTVRRKRHECAGKIV